MTLENFIQMNQGVLNVQNNRPWETTILGQYKKDATGQDSFDPVFQSNGVTNKGGKQLMPPSKFLRGAFSLNSISGGALVLSTRSTFRNVFDRDSNLYNALLERVLEGKGRMLESTYTDRSGQTLQQFLLSDKISGEVININCPPHRMVDANGNPIGGFRFDPATGDYLETSETVLTSRSEFVLEGEARLPILVRLWNRWIEPNLIKVEGGDQQDYAGLEPGQQAPPNQQQNQETPTRPIQSQQGANLGNKLLGNG